MNCKFGVRFYCDKRENIVEREIETFVEVDNDAMSEYADVYDYLQTDVDLDTAVKNKLIKLGYEPTDLDYELLGVAGSD